MFVLEGNYGRANAAKNFQATEEDGAGTDRPFSALGIGREPRFHSKCVS